MKKFRLSSLALALAAPMAVATSAQAQAGASPNPGANVVANEAITTLRQEIDAIRSAYEARLQALEARLKAAEATAAAAPAVLPLPAASTAAQVPAGAGANAFNPAISLILSGLYQRSSRDPADYRLSGVPLPPSAEIGPGGRGFSLTESELGLAASIDPFWRGVANIALHPDDTVSVEEAYVQTTALGSGLSLKAGRFFSGVGYLNEQHAHTWDFVDNPLAYQALLGTQYGDDGLQLRWLAPTDQYLEFGLELGRGRSFPGSDSAHNGAGMSAITAHTGGDIGESHSWRAGVSLLGAKASDQALGLRAVDGADLGGSFNGRTRVWVLDGIWKWAPNGNATHTSFKLQGEWLRSTRTGSLGLDGLGEAAYRVQASGWYVQGVYQFMPAWRVGLRTERLDPGRPDYSLGSALLDESAHRPRKTSLMLDFNASEFSRVRLQFARDQARDGVADKQISLQYQMSLGAHGAHSY